MVVRPHPSRRAPAAGACRTGVRQRRRVDALPLSGWSHRGPEKATERRTLAKNDLY
jgi:hypothetical protein